MIINYIFSFLLLILSGVIQSHPSFNYLEISGIKPDLQFVLIIFLAYQYGPLWGELTGFAGGLIQDSLSTSLLGLFAFPKMFLGLLVGLSKRLVLADNVIVFSFLVLLASFLKGIVIFFLTVIFQSSPASLIFFPKIIFPEALYNALLAPLLYLVFKKIFKLKLEEDE